MEINLDKVIKDTKYPVGTHIEGLIKKSDVQIVALNECVLTLAGVTRSEKGIQLKWQNSNPGEYPTYVHIGIPPVIGSDGILYGLYESPDLASIPVAQPRARPPIGRPMCLYPGMQRDFTS